MWTNMCQFARIAATSLHMSSFLGIEIIPKLLADWENWHRAVREAHALRGTILPWCLGGFRGPLNFAPMMPKMSQACRNSKQGKNSLMEKCTLTVYEKLESHGKMSPQLRVPLNLLNTIECCDGSRGFRWALNWAPWCWETPELYVSVLLFGENCTQRNLSEILLNQTEMRLHLTFSNWLETKRTSVCFQINRKMVYTIQFRVHLIRSRKYFSVCTQIWKRI